MVTFLSKTFRPRLKLIPKNCDFISKSHKLFSYYGLIHSSTPGTYTIMPMLQLSLDRLINIISHNMSNIGAEKVTMPSLIKSSYWKQSGRLPLLHKELLQLSDLNNDLILQPTHEEEISNLMFQCSPISSRKLPALFYQITPKFRNEIAPKSGLLRSREFLMKDLYAFDTDEESSRQTYEMVLQQYKNLFSELELDFHCVEADSGNMGGSVSHEFHVESSAGEDVVYQCDSCGSCFNKEGISKDSSGSNRCSKVSCSGTLRSMTTIEIGHCFLLGDKYSKAFNLLYRDSAGKNKHTIMSCYGIGVTRLLAVVVETMSTNDRIRWPRCLVPYFMALLLQKPGATNAASGERETALIRQLRSTLGPSVLVDDDGDVTLGSKTRYADCLGLPWSLILKDRPELELIDNYSGQTRYASLEECVQIIMEDRHRSYSSIQPPTPINYTLPLQ